MANLYYNITYSFTQGTKANGSEVKAETDAIAAGFDLLPNPADIASVTDIQPYVDYATEWANKAEDSLVSAAAGGDQVDDYSSLHFAAKAAADVALTNADVVLTNADVVATAALYDQFDDRYLGSKASDPTLDNDSNSLLTGALYWNTTTDNLKVYSGSVWATIDNYVHPNHTGDVTSSGDGATTIAAGAVTLAKMDDMATASMLGRNTAGTGAPEVLSASVARSTMGLGTIATQDDNSVDINGGAIDATPIGSTAANTARFTTMQATGATTLINGVAAQQPPTLIQLQSGVPFYYVAGGTANAITFTTAPVLGAVASGQPFLIKIATENTTAVTIARDGLTANDLTLANGQSLLGGHLLAGGFYWIAHDGTDYSLLNPSPVVDGAYASPGSVTSLATGVAKAVDFSAETYDTRGYHDTVTNNSRLTIPTGGDGYYELFASLGIASNATNKRIIAFYKNGVALPFSSDDDAPTGTYKRSISHPPIALVATDYIEVYGFQNSGGGLNTINADSALAIRRVG